MKTKLKKTNKLSVKILALCTVLGAALQGYAQPTTVAPIPSAPQGHVISLWNSAGTYTNVPVDNYNEDWYGTTPGTFTIPSTSSTVFTELGMVCCGGWNFSSNPVNVSGCTNLHVDVFTPNGNGLRIRLVDSTAAQADMVFPAGGAITAGSWISLNIPLSMFTGINLHSVKQLGWIDNADGDAVPADYYIDNVYFSGSTNLVYSPPPPIPVPTNNAAIPTRPASSVLAMYDSSGTYPLWPGSAGVSWDASWSGSGEFPFTITNLPNTVMYLPGLAYVGVEFYDPNQVDTTGYTGLHFDVWALRGNQIGVQLVSLSPTQPAEIYSPISVTNQWVGIDIPLSQFSAVNPNTVLSHLQQLLWVDNGGPGIQGGTFYIDNVYFYSNAVVPPPTATTVYVDPAQTWVGYMNVFDLPANGGAYDFGSSWGTAALPATFAGKVLTLAPNVNTYNASDAYWVNPDGSGNKSCDASFYVENDTLAGQTLTFTGYCGGNTLVAPYTSTAYIKDFSPSYSLNGSIAVPFTNGQPFSISLLTTAGDHIQYGFETVGPDANPATVASLGTVLIGSNAAAFAGPVTNGIHASIASGTLVGWTASSANAYQAQKSSDNATWTSVGSLLFGNTVTSQFDLGKAPFYRVQQITPGGANVVPNPSFEVAASPANAIGATNWNIAVLPNAGATMLVTNQYGSVQPYAGAEMLLIQSATAASGSVPAPNTDVRSDLFPVTAGQTYNVSFYAANLAKVGGANPQYDFFFYNAANGAVGGPTFTSFSSVGSSWTQVTATVTPPAGATQMTIGWIQAAGAGNGENWVTLIDNVVVTTGAISGPTNILSATTQPGVQISWPTATGTNYQVQSAAQLQATPVWSAFGSQISGNGATNFVTDAVSGAQKYYRVLGMH